MYAATLTWTGAASDRWSNAANWSPAAVPHSGDDLLFPPAATPSVNDLDPAVVLASLTFSSSTTITGAAVPVSGAVSAPCSVALTLPVRAMSDSFTIAAGTLAGTLDVNGHDVDFGSAGCASTLSAAVSGAGTLRVAGDTQLPAAAAFSGSVICASSCMIDGAWSSATFTGAGTITGNGTVGVYGGRGILIAGRPLTVGRFASSPSEWRFALTTASDFTRIVVLSGNIQVAGKLVIDGITTASGCGTVSPARCAAYDGILYVPDNTDFTLIENRSSGAISGRFVDEAGPPLEQRQITETTPHWAAVVIYHFSPPPQPVDFVMRALRVNYTGGHGNDFIVTTVDASSIATKTEILGLQCPKLSFPYYTAVPVSCSAHVRVTRADGRPAIGMVMPRGSTCCFLNETVSGNLQPATLRGGEGDVSAWMHGGGYQDDFYADYKGPLGVSSAAGENLFLPPETERSSISMTPEHPRAGEPVTFRITRTTNCSTPCVWYTKTNVTVGRYDPRDGTLEELVSLPWAPQPGGNSRETTDVASMVRRLPPGTYQLLLWIDFPPHAPLPPQGLGCCANGLRFDVLPDDTHTAIATPSLTAGLATTIDAGVTAARSQFVPTGTMTLREGAKTLATAPLDAQASAKLLGAPLPVGEHTLTVAYAGDVNFNPSSATVVQNVGKTPVELSIRSSLPNSTYGQPVTFTIAATPPVSAPLTISIGRSEAARVDAAGGTATWTTDALPAGPLSIVVTCADNCIGTASALQRVEKANVTLVANAEPFTPAGAATRVAVAATLQSSTLAPGGTIAIEENGTLLGSAALDGGRAALSVGPLASGAHRLSVRYAATRNCGEAAVALDHVVLAPALALTGASVIEGNEAATRVVATARLDNPSLQPVSAAWSTADRTAVDGRDYRAAAGTLTFAPGQTEGSIEITILGNRVPEPAKTFAIVLSDAAGASIPSQPAIVRIVNDDPFFAMHAGLAYGSDPAQTLDLRVPLEGSGPFPLVVGIETSGFIAPNPECTLTVHEAERGYAVATLSFRSGDVAPFPAQRDDVTRAIGWLRANAARYGLDPNRIAVWGIGPGGHLAALLGTSRDARVQAIVDWFGEIDLTTLSDPSYAQYLGCVPSDCPDRAAAANAAVLAAPGDPPFLIMHGSSDDVVPVRNSQALYLALRNAGVEARFRIVDGLTHDDAGWDDPVVLDVVDRFLDEILGVTPAAFSAEQKGRR